MPSYTYRCPKCKFFIDIVMTMKEYSEMKPTPVCVQETCGDTQMERVITGTSFYLKGNGWSKDGYAK